MDPDRRQRYLENLLRGRTTGTLQSLVPIVNRWNELLDSIPGLRKRRPGAHCRIFELQGGILTVEADHPAWLQLLQWHQNELVDRVAGAFPTLNIQTVQFRLSRPGDPVDRPTVVMPDPVKPSLSEAEERQRDALIAELEAMIKEKSERG